MKKIILLPILLCFALTSCEPESNPVEQPIEPILSACAGNFIIKSLFDTESLKKCSSVTGNILIDSEYSQGLNLANLKNLTLISGDLEISGKTLVDLKGLENLEEIGGNLIIDGITNINSIDLGSLEKIGGDFIISGSGKLSVLDLKKLKSIGGKFEYINNVSEIEFNSLNALETVDQISFYNNPGLEIIGSFEKLRKFNLIHVSNNLKLKEIKGFTNLVEIKNIDISENTSLTTLNGFGALTLISGNITLNSNMVLENIQAFNSLKHIVGAINILNNHINFQNSFPALKIVGAEIHITNNTHEGYFQSFRELETFTGEAFSISYNLFSSFHGPDKLKKARTIGFHGGTRGKLEGFDQLTDIEGRLEIFMHKDPIEVIAFKNLKTVGGHLYVAHNDKIQNLAPLLNSVEQIGGEFRIENNEELQQFWVGDQLKFIGGPVVISTNQSLIKAGGFNGVTNNVDLIFIIDNYELKEFIGFTGITSIKNIGMYRNLGLKTISGFSSLKLIEKEFILQGNSKLDLLDGFRSLEEVGIYFFIGEGEITNLVNFGNLKKIGQEFKIGGVKGLRSLQGLENLTSPIKIIDIHHNPQLTDISALRNIGTITESINMVMNERLAVCSIKPICQFISAGGAVYLNYNAEGCNTSSQILEKC